MNWNLVLVVAGIASAIVCKIDDNSKLQRIANNIRTAAEEEVESTQVDFSELRELRKERDTSKSLFENMKKDEEKEINIRIKTDEAAREASSKLDILNNQYSKAKMAVNNFKPDKVAVSVGSGDNSVSVEAENSSAKIALEKDLLDISEKQKAAQKEWTDIKNQITKNVKDNRTKDFYDAKKAYEQASKNYNEAVEAKDRSVNKLLNNREWTHKQFVKNYQAMHTKPELIAKGTVYSIVPVAILVYIWKRVFDGINTLKEVV